VLAAAGAWKTFKTQGKDMASASAARNAFDARCKGE